MPELTGSAPQDVVVFSNPVRVVFASHAGKRTTHTIHALLPLDHGAAASLIVSGRRPGDRSHVTINADFDRVREIILASSMSRTPPEIGIPEEGKLPNVLDGMNINL